MRRACPIRVETVAGSSRSGDGGPPLAAQFSAIQGIALDRLGNLYISDTDHHRVRKVSGGVVTTVAGTGAAGFSGDGKAAASAQLNLPYGLALDGAGNLYIADEGNQRVRRVTPGGSDFDHRGDRQAGLVPRWAHAGGNFAAGAAQRRHRCRREPLYL